MSERADVPDAIAEFDVESGAVPWIATDPEGLQVVDPIERRQERFRTDPAPAAVEPVSTDRVPAPVGTAARLSVSALELDRPSVVNVVDADWSAVTQLDHGDRTTVAGDHSFNVSGPMKLYVRAVGEATVTVGETTRIEAPDADLFLGARSLHSRPATRITVREDPADLMAALSVAGSALKTTTPDRSWPTLRGHPPAIDLGDELTIPEGLRPPVPEVRVVVPRDLRYVYPVAPLSYYLGAPIEAGWPPRLETDDGFSYPLGADPDDTREFERAVSRTLRGVFFVETLARSAGLMHFPIRERAALAGSLPFSFEEFYEFSPERRLKAALSVPFEDLREYVPDWEAVAHVPPEPSAVETLPYLLDDLALVTTRTGRATDRAELDRRTRRQASQVDSFLRDPDPTDADGRETAGDGVLPRPDGGVRYGNDRGRSAADGAPTRTEGYHTLDADVGANALDDVWVGDSTPLEGTHALEVAYENRHNRSLSVPPIEVSVVCNGEAMTDELVAASIYDEPADVPFDVTVYRDLSTAALRTLLERDAPAFFHYVGHAGEEGLQCPDGYLDLSTLGETTLDTFLLNACDSYAQGVALLEAGAVGGITTFRDVNDHTAVDVGTTVARMLNAGYPLRVAMDVCKEANDFTDLYMIVGDGRAAIGQNTVSPVYYVEPIGPDRFRFRVRHYPGVAGMGGSAKCYIGDDEVEHQLIGNESRWLTVSADTLREQLDRQQVPVLSGENLYWSQELELSSLP